MNHYEELVKAFLEGDNNAFEAIYRATYKNVYFTCLSFLKNEKDAEDVTQDVYEAVYRNVKTLKNPETLQIWMYKIAVNKCKNVLKKEKAILVEEETLENIVTENNENFLPEEYITEKSKRKIVMDIMRKKLSDIQYQTVILFYFNELSVEEIADIMECPPGTVKYRLSVSRDKIKEGVLEYEKKNRDKLYSLAPVPFLTGLLAMEAEAAEVPDMWSVIAQRLNILQGSMTAGTKMMKGSNMIRKVKHILLSVIKNKIVVTIVCLAVVAAFAVAVVNILEDDENNSDEIEVAQGDTGADDAVETGEIAEEGVETKEYDEDVDPYFYRQNSWIGIHDYTTGQLENQPEVVICPAASETITLPFTPEQIRAQVPSCNEYYVTTRSVAPYFSTEADTDERLAAEYEFKPEWAEKVEIVAFNLSESEMVVEDWIHNNYVAIRPIGSTDVAFAEIFGMDLSTIEESEGVDDAFSEAAMEILTEKFGSPNYIYYNYAEYRGDNIIENFYANIFFIWEFEDYTICVKVDEDFKENENGEYVVNLKNLCFEIFSPSVWSVFKEGEFIYTKEFLTLAPGENQIDKISVEDFMPLDCEYPQTVSESEK